MGALAVPGHAPQLVIAHAVAAVEVADAVGAVVGGAQPDRALARRRAHAVAWPDRQRPELVKAEAPVMSLFSTMRTNSADRRGD